MAIDELKIENWGKKSRAALLEAVEDFADVGATSGDSGLHLKLVQMLNQYIKKNDCYWVHSKKGAKSKFKTWWANCCHDMALSQKKLAIVCAALNALNSYAGDGYAKDVFKHIQKALITARSVREEEFSPGTLEKMLEEINEKGAFTSGESPLSRNPYKDTFNSSSTSLRPR